MRRFFILAALVAATGPASAQFGKNPFSLGVDEGAVGHVGRLGLYLLQQQAHFYQALRLAVEAAQKSPSAVFWLAAVAFAYGVFHAAGPGHGKAVIASYMLANERALKRGLVLSGLAALLQALVAIGIVGVAAVLLGVTAQKMAAATHWVEIAAYVCIASLGAWLVWRKGAAFLAACRAPRLAASSRFQCDDPAHDEKRGLACAHCVAPDPATLGDNFSWRSSAVTVVAAGSRPCSGALLVLVFAFAQGAFSIGVWATLAMAAGTALTTGALAASAVLAKGAMTKVLGAQTRGAEIFARALELLAAAVVLFLGLSLLAGLFASGRSWSL
jgi:ABC-type nickel/cobalt efflux system permease component RcnA